MIKLKSLIKESSESDDYYYHVTLAPYVPFIESRGLKVGSRPTVSNYTQHSRGKIFLCDKETVDRWVWIIAEHAFHNYDDEAFHDVAIFRIPKSKLSNVEIDDIGTQDTGGNAYYVTENISPELLEFVKVVKSPV